MIGFEVTTDILSSLRWGTSPSTSVPSQAFARNDLTIATREEVRSTSQRPSRWLRLQIYVSIAQEYHTLAKYLYPFALTISSLLIPNNTSLTPVSSSRTVFALSPKPRDGAGCPEAHHRDGPKRRLLLRRPRSALSALGCLIQRRRRVRVSEAVLQFTHGLARTL